MIIIIIYSISKMSCGMNFLAKRIKESGVKINVIAIDFFDTGIDDDDENSQDFPEQKPARAPLTPAQRKNKDLLNLFCQNCSAKVFPTSVALEIYRQFRKVEKKAVAKFSGTFEISDDL